MQTVNEHAIIVSLKSVFIAYDYLRKITKTNRGGYAISTIRRWELDRSTELLVTVTFGSSTSFWHDPRNFWIPKCMLMHL